MAATRSYMISTAVSFQSLCEHQRHPTRGSGVKIKILRFALTGSNPEYPPGPDPASILCSDSTRTKNRRRRRVRCPEFHTPASGAQHQDHLMLQRRVHQPCELQERAGVVAA